MRAMFSGGGVREELMEKMTAMREALEVEIKTILSPEQFKKYQELRSQQSQRGGRSRESRNESTPLAPSKRN
jgi:hypothetical protein